MLENVHVFMLSRSSTDTRPFMRRSRPETAKDLVRSRSLMSTASKHPRVGRDRKIAGKRRVNVEEQSDSLWPSIGEPKEYGSDEKLYQEIYDFILAHIDIPDDRWYHILSCFVMATHLANKFNTATYIAFVGDVATGKSDALYTLKLLCHKACFIDRPTRGSLSRLLAKYHPTLLLDNVDKINRGDQIDIASILESGYKKGVKIPRTVNWQRPDFDVLGLGIFGPKAYAGNSQFMEKSMTSRCLTIYMDKNVRPVTRPFNEKKADEIRSKLVMWAQRHSDDPPLPQHNDLFKDGRLYELIYPLLCVAPTMPVRGAIEEIGKLEDAERESDFQNDVKRDSARTVVELAGKDSERSFTALDVKKHLEALGYSDSNISVEKIGFILKGFGCDHLRQGSGRSRRWYYTLSRQNRERLMYRYGIRANGSSQSGR